jgi:hypothetical protein
MKKILLSTLVFAVLGFSGCSEPQNKSDPAPSSASVAPPEPAATEEPPSAPDLSGTWKQSNSRSDVDYMTAEVAAGVMTINWVLGSQDIDAIFWVGSFQPPSDASTPYTWTSTRDAAATETALLASTEDTKDFAYRDGTISFEVSIQGESATVELKKV